MDELDLEELVCKALLKALEYFGRKALKEVQKWHQAKEKEKMEQKEVEFVKKLKG